MSAVEARPRAGWAPSAVLALGGVVLLLRVRVLALPDGDRIAALSLLYSALLIGSLLIPAARGRHASMQRSLAVFAAALGGIMLAVVLGGHPVPVPFGPWILPLSMLAAVAEEAFFRRSLYGFLESVGGPMVAIVCTSLAFAVVHVPLYGLAAFPVDLGAGLLLGWQRWETGDWTVPAATHAAANLLAVILR